MFPDILHRGDDDSKNERKLRSTIGHGQLQTNLLKGGDGSKIFNEDLLELINNHVLSKFNASHFLSFTEEKKSAFRFGMKLYEELTDEAIEECATQAEDDLVYWDFAMLYFDTTQLKIISNTYHGIYECQFEPQLLTFKRLGVPYTVFLIDAAKALDHRYKHSMELSSFDKEWLILPAMPIQFTGRVEFSGILDGACISSEKYVINREEWDKYNMISYK